MNAFHQLSSRINLFTVHHNYSRAGDNRIILNSRCSGLRAKQRKSTQSGWLRAQYGLQSQDPSLLTRNYQPKKPYKETAPWRFNTIFHALCIINNHLVCVWEQRELPAGVLKAENLSTALPGHTHKLTFKQGAAGWTTDVSPKQKGWLYILQEVPPSIRRPFSIYSLELSLEWTATKLWGKCAKNCRFNT